MPAFSNAKDLERHLKKALDAFVFETIKATQGAIGSDAVHPYLTGRMRSGWFSQEGSPSNAVPPEGADSPSTDASSLRVDSSKEYHLTNNLPYAQYICLEEGAVSKSKNWFIDFRDVTIGKIQADAAAKTKAQFDL
jgi:hypothetical protein